MKTKELTGTVTNVDDPSKAGRIKVRLNSMDGGEYPEWIEPDFLPGWFSMPEPGDTISVFVPEGNDIIEFPEEVRYRGQVLNDATPVPEEFQINYPKRRGYKTAGGHLLIFDDQQGSEEITISHRGTLLVSLTNDGIFFGTQSATENFILGQSWKTMMTTFMSDFVSHTHPTGVGPSGPPRPPESTSVSSLSSALGTHLSDFIFGQKTKP